MREDEGQVFHVFVLTLVQTYLPVLPLCAQYTVKSLHELTSPCPLSDKRRPQAGGVETDNTHW